MLNEHSWINWRSELFHDLHENDQGPDKADRAIEQLHAEIRNSRSTVFGFETKFQHLDENGLDLSLEAFIEQLTRSGFRHFMMLRRRNYLRQAISVARGQQTQAWHFQTGKRPPGIQQVRLDLNNIGLGGKNRSLLDCFGWLDRTYAAASELAARKGIMWLEIDYEKDLEKDPFVGYQKVVDFLSIPREKPGISLHKIGGQPIQDMTENFDQIQACLQGTEYEWMLG